MYLCGHEKRHCKHRQALQPPQQQRAPLQLGSDYHEDESQRALLGGEQRWPLPLQPSESYPKYPLYLIKKKQTGSRNLGKKIMKTREQSGVEVKKCEQSLVLLDDFLTGLFPNPSIPARRHSDPIPIKKFN